MAKVDLSAEAMDAILEKMEAGLTRVEASQHSVVKLRNAEVELLQDYEAARDFMMTMLSNPTGEREVLQSVFGGDCDRIARISVNLESAKFSEMYRSDPRIPGCKNACESVEKVLQDLGLGWALRQALEKEKEAAAKRRSILESGEMEAARKAALEAAEATKVEAAEVTKVEVVEPAPKPEPKPPVKLRDNATEMLMATADETLIDRILNCVDAAELVELEPDKKESLANWMIWMVHRAHLNDPTLVKFDFTNLQMPPGHEEPRISPKLCKAMETNSHIQQLLLPNTKLSAREGAILATSLCSNQTVRVMNLDSNFLAQDELESIANAAGTSKTLEELRINNQHGVSPGRQLYEALANAVKANTMIVKLGLTVNDPHFRGQIDSQIMRNADLARKRRLEARKAAEAAAAKPS
mmetsp:Transcript_113247/g.218042  ORF Transcript_113247/g.218042 Transcript_113247/m.218042 type:complete len:412 (-) Transcript_113247:33-1268(-)